MQRFGTDYKFENYKINIRDAGEKDSLYMVDVDIDVDDDDVYTAKMPDNEEKIMKWVKMTGRNL